MAIMQHDTIGNRLYETGVRKGALYLENNGAYPSGVPFNGLTSAKESPSGAEAQDKYADDIKYLSLMSAEKFEGTIEGFYSPKEFDQCDGTAELVPGVKLGQQPRKSFGFAFLSILGNDTQANEYSEVLHLWYGCKASPTERSYSSVSDSPEPATMSWKVSSTPVMVPGSHKPTSSITIEKLAVGESKWAKLMEAVYGTDSTDPYLPTPTQLVELLK